jgi:hypothetical protein
MQGLATFRRKIGSQAIGLSSCASRKLQGGTISRAPSVAPPHTHRTLYQTSLVESITLRIPGIFQNSQLAKAVMPFANALALLRWSGAATATAPALPSPVLAALVGLFLAFRGAARLLREGLLTKTHYGGEPAPCATAARRPDGAKQSNQWLRRTPPRNSDHPHPTPTRSPGTSSASC